MPIREETEDLLASFWHEEPRTCSKLLASFLAHFEPARQLQGAARMQRSYELLAQLAIGVAAGRVPEVPPEWEEKRAGMEALQVTIRKTVELLSSGHSGLRELARPLRPTELALTCRAFAGDLRLRGDVFGAGIFEAMAEQTEQADLAHRVILRGELRRAWVRSRAS